MRAAYSGACVKSRAVAYDGRSGRLQDAPLWLIKSTDAPGFAATNEVSSSMSDSSEFKIQQWERYIDESRRELKLLSPEGQIAMQKVIDSYERLIAMERGKDKRG
jgi:hypothetical protein